MEKGKGGSKYLIPVFTASLIYYVACRHGIWLQFVQYDQFYLVQFYWLHYSYANDLSKLIKKFIFTLAS